MKILIIEDSKSQIHLLNKIVKQIKDTEPILAADALEGFAILRAIPDIFLILLDNDMPFIKGINFLKKIKSDPILKKIPVLLSTAETNTQQFIDAGAAKCFVKPYDITRFKESIETLRDQN